MAILATAILLNTAQEQAYKSEYETTLADLNQYTTATHLILGVIILMDDAIKYTCIWPFV